MWVLARLIFNPTFWEVANSSATILFASSRSVQYRLQNVGSSTFLHLRLCLYYIFYQSWAKFGGNCVVLSDALSDFWSVTLGWYIQFFKNVFQMKMWKFFLQIFIFSNFPLMFHILCVVVSAFFCWVVLFSGNIKRCNFPRII